MPNPREDLLRLCQTDLHALCTRVLGFKEAVEPNHERMCQFIEQPYPFRFMVGARGVFKTSCCTVGHAIQRILQDPEVRILVVSNVKKNARKMVGQMLAHFKSNELLRSIAPSLCTTPCCADEFLVERKGIYPEPTVTRASVDTQMASGHFTDIFGDDLMAADYDNLKEDGVIFIPQEEINKAIGWEELNRPGLSIRRGKGFAPTRVQYIVNRWCVQDFARFMIDDKLECEERPKGFRYLELAAYDEDDILTFPNTLGEAELDGVTNNWILHTQYFCRPYDPKNRGFPPKFNVYWDGDLPPGAENMRRFGLMDLAGEATRRADYTAFVVLFVDRNNHIWVAEALRGRSSIPDKLKLIRDMVTKYDLPHIYIEKNLNDESFQHVIAEDKRKTGVFYGVRQLHAKNRNKDARILQLQPHHENRAIHLKRSQTDLLTEMRDYPSARYKDIIDTLGYAMDLVKRPYNTLAAEEAKRYVNPDITTPREIMKIAEQKQPQWANGGFTLQGPNRRKVAV